MRLYSLWECKSRFLFLICSFGAHLMRSAVLRNSSHWTILQLNQVSMVKDTVATIEELG